MDQDQLEARRDSILKDADLLYDKADRIIRIAEYICILLSDIRKPDEKMTAKNIERLVKSWENDLNQAKKELPNIYNLLRVLDQQLR